VCGTSLKYVCEATPISLIQHSDLSHHDTELFHVTGSCIVIYFMRIFPVVTFIPLLSPLHMSTHVHLQLTYSHSFMFCLKEVFQIHMSTQTLVYIVRSPVGLVSYIYYLPE
jgi:hypothetical protein